MSHPSNLSAGLEPTAETIDLVCDRLADLGLAAGPDVARDLVRAILAAEAPRLDARVREALATSLETVRVATQSALGMLAATVPGPTPASLAASAAPNQAAAPKPAQPSVPPIAPPVAPAGPAAPPLAAPVESRRPIARRGAKAEPDVPPQPDRSRDLPDAGTRPVFKRPRGR